MDIPEITQMIASITIETDDGKVTSFGKELKDYPKEGVEGLVEGILEFLAEEMGPPPEAIEYNKH